MNVQFFFIPVTSALSRLIDVSSTNTHVCSSTGVTTIFQIYLDVIKSSFHCEIPLGREARQDKLLEEQKPCDQILLSASGRHAQQHGRIERGNNGQFHKLQRRQPASLSPSPSPTTLKTSSVAPSCRLHSLFYSASETLPQSHEVSPHTDNKCLMTTLQGRRKVSSSHPRLKIKKGLTWGFTLGAQQHHCNKLGETGITLGRPRPG